MIPTCIQLILNAILVIVTAVYAILTHRIAKSNEKAVEAMKAQTEALIRPYITVTHSRSSTTLVSLCIKNTGKSNAENLRLKIDKDFFQIGRGTHNIASTFAFQNVIESFPPDAQLVFPLFSSLEVEHDDQKDTSTPSVFSITATYSFSGKTVTVTTTVDLRIYRGIFLPSESIEEKLGQLVGLLKELK